MWGKAHIEAYLASCAKGTGVPFPYSKATGAIICPLTSIQYGAKNE
jgi:hypothetical protein